MVGRAILKAVGKRGESIVVIRTHFGDKSLRWEIARDEEYYRKLLIL